MLLGGSGDSAHSHCLIVIRITAIRIPLRPPATLPDSTSYLLTYWVLRLQVRVPVRVPFTALGVGV